MNTTKIRAPQIEIPPNIAVSDAVGKLKAASSRHLRYQVKFIREIYLEKRRHSGAVGYFSSTVGSTSHRVKRYIQWQSRKELPQKARFSESHAS